MSVSHSRRRIALAVSLIALALAGWLSLVLFTDNSGARGGPLDAHAKGIAAGGGYDTLSDSDLANRLDDIVSLGATWIRLDIDWSTVQPQSSSSSDWSNLDRVIDAARARHLQVLGIVDGTAPWARPAGCQSADCAPANPQTYGKFAGQVAVHYQGRVAALELGNEPNLRQFMKPAPDPELYAKMLIAAYKAIDHKVWVIAGGTSNINAGGTNIAPEDWLHRLYAAGARGYFDAYSFHVYPAAKPAADPKEALARLAKLRSIMVGNQDASKTIWITETGYATSGSDASKYVSQTTQAANLATIIKRYKTLPWAGPLFVYSLRDEYNPADQGDASDAGNYQNFFGLTDHDGHAKPAYQVIKQSNFTYQP